MISPRCTAASLVRVDYRTEGWKVKASTLQQDGRTPTSEPYTANATSSTNRSSGRTTVLVIPSAGAPTLTVALAVTAGLGTNSDGNAIASPYWLKFVDARCLLICMPKSHTALAHILAKHSRHVGIDMADVALCICHLKFIVGTPHPCTVFVCVPMQPHAKWEAKPPPVGSKPSTAGVAARYHFQFDIRRII